MTENKSMRNSLLNPWILVRVLFPEIQVLGHIRHAGFINRKLFKRGREAYSSAGAYSAGKKPAATILNTIGNLIAIAYGIFYIPGILFFLIFTPILAIAEGAQVITTGYSVAEEYIWLLPASGLFIYVSLRFRCLRKIYNVFPFLFEPIKFLTIAFCFIAFGTEVLNESYIVYNHGGHSFGISVFIASLVLWRIVISVYYYTKPLVNLIPMAQEEILNYREMV